ncbi:MAG: ParB/RepB/Spo0J family partition protein [Clostridia bacterium]|nr:ParB/RepB/Spo0J family partition protein [Clostridia bacterium]
MELTSVDDLFEGVAGKDVFNVERAIPIPIEKLYDFPDHPFKVVDNEELRDMSETIKERGILHPLIVRQREDGNYEIISGHRRKKASQLANLKELPCIVRNLTRDEAIIQMVDSNMQREKVLPSERAFAYKMKLEAQRNQGKRSDLANNETSRQVVEKLGSADEIGKQTGESGRQVQRWIRLTELIKPLLDLVDEERIAFTPAVDLSYLTEDEQMVLHNIFLCDEKTPNVSQARYLKLLSQEKRLTTEKIEEIMQKEKPNQIEKFKFNRDRIEELLPRNVATDKQVEDFIIQCIKEHNAREKKRQERDR